jgi:hypothetical protein
MEQILEDAGFYERMRIRERTTIAQKLLRDSVPVDKIIDYTGLTQQEIEQLKQPA